MKTFIRPVIIVATISLAAATLAGQKPHVITGRIVKLSEQNMVVESGKERVEINYFGVKYAAKPKVGDTVTVEYTSGHHQYRADPDNIASRIEVKTPTTSKQ